MRPASMTLAALMLGGLAGVTQGAPPAAPPAGPSPWSAATAPPLPAKPAEDSTLTLRLYENPQAAPLPYRPPRPGPRGRDEPTWAADVSAVMTRCADGNLVITALVIGGQLTPLNARCPAGEAEQPVAPAPPCDARTWNCTTAPNR